MGSGGTAKGTRLIRCWGLGSAAMVRHIGTLKRKQLERPDMNRRTLLSLLGLALFAVAAPVALQPALAKDGGGDHDGGEGGGGEEGGEGRADSPEDREDNGGDSMADAPGEDSQPEDATACAAGVDCKKE